MVIITVYQIQYTNNQESYMENIQPIHLEGSRKKNRKLLHEEKDALRSVNGQISRVANQTRPDTTYADDCE